jgi:tight adherence protein C
MTTFPTIGLPTILAAFLFVLLVAIITVYGYRAYVRPSRIYDQVGGTTELVQTESANPRELAARFVQQIGNNIPLSAGDQTVIRRDLTMAGFRADSATAIFYGLKVIGAVVMFGVGLLVRNSLADNTVPRMVILVGCTAFGYYFPTLGLEKLVKQRQLKLRLSLPDALDMLVVAVEAGLGLDQAMQYVSREITAGHPELAEELTLVGFEMRAGKRRAESLRNLATRTGEAELRKLVAILTQSDRFGTSMGESLRTHSDFMRLRRKQDAEERAAKIGVKLVFPIFLFILPSMMLVAAGPALLKIFEDLFPMMQAFGK